MITRDFTFEHLTRVLSSIYFQYKITFSSVTNIWQRNMLSCMNVLFSKVSSVCFNLQITLTGIDLIVTGAKQLCFPRYLLVCIATQKVCQVYVSIKSLQELAFPFYCTSGHRYCVNEYVWLVPAIFIETGTSWIWPKLYSSLMPQIVSLFDAFQTFGQQVS